MKRDQRFLLFSLLPAIIVLAAITLFPFFYLIFLSTHSWNISEPGSFKFNGIQNYISLFKDTRFQESIVRTLQYVGIAVFSEFGLGLAFALILSRKFWGRKVVIPILIAPLGVTPIVASLVWKIMYHSEYGLINYFIELLGMTPPLWISDQTVALYSIIIVDIWRWTPLMFVIFTAGLVALPKEIFEAADIDGASSWKKFSRITWPLMIPISSIAFLMRFMDAFKAFDIIYGLTKKGPGTNTETMNILLLLRSFRYYDFGLGSTIALIMLLLVIGLSTAFVKLLNVHIGESIY
jgi:multiple sugar transport system permease protein